MTGAGDTQFFGRGWEQAEIHRAVDEAAAGRGGLVLVGGEPGIGKTALVREVVAGLRPTGGRTVWATCAEDTPGYWPWMQVALDLVGGPGSPAGAGEPGPPPGIDRRALHVLLPGPESDGDGSAAPAFDREADHGAARLRLFRAVADLLDAAGASAPLVIVLDDLHLADRPSLLLLQYLASRLGAVAVVATYREAEVRLDPAARDLFAALSRSARAIHLGGLDTDDLAGLVRATAGADAPAAWVAGLQARTAGNPFFAREIVRLLRAQGLEPGGDRFAGVPTTVREVVERRLARLPQTVNDLLTVAAVLGEEFSVEHLSAAGHFVDAASRRAGVDAVLDALDTAADAGLVRRAADRTGRLGFAHALVREALYENLGPGRRAALHRAVGLGLEASGRAPVEALAHHFFAAVPAGEADRAVRYGLSAGDGFLDRLAHEDARRWYDRVLDVLAADPVGVASLRARLGRAEALRRSGDMAGSRADLESVLDAGRDAPDPRCFVEAALGLQRLGRTSGSPRTETIEVLDEARLRLAGTEPELEALVLSSLARELYHEPGEPWARAAELSAEALRLAEEGDRAGTLARCLLARHDVLWGPGRAGERARLATRMEEAAGSRGDEELRAEAVLLEATARFELGDEGAADVLERFLGLAAGLRLPRFDYLVLTRRAAAATMRGESDEAREAIVAAAVVAAETGEPDAANVESFLRWELARFTTGPGALADEIDALAPERPAAYHMIWRALCMADAGRDREAAEAFAALAALDPDGIRRDWIWVSTVADLGGAAVRSGAREVAERCYRALLPFAGTNGVVGGFVAFCGAVDHHLGRLALAAGRPVEATAHLAAALAMHERLGAHLWVAATRAALEQATRRPVPPRIGPARPGLALGTAGPGPAPGQSPAPAPRRAEPADAAGALTRLGKVWRVTWQGVDAPVPDAKGVQDLAVLLSRPGQEVHAVDLYAGPAGGPAGRGEPVIDEEARAAYRRRLATLDEELADAEACHDPERAARARVEREALVDELRRVYDVHGRLRRTGDLSERARKAVSARLRDAVRLLADAHPGLGDHLRRSVRTGTFCAYEPADPVRWEIR